MKLLTSMGSPKIPQAEGGSVLSLRRRVQAGGAFMLGGFGVAQILRLLSSLILTRLLVPEAFGLMAVAVSINIWAIMLTDIGISTSVIRSHNSDDPEFSHTAWVMQIARNVLVWLIIMVAAGGVYLLAMAGNFRADSIFADPLLPWIMTAAGMQLVITAFSSINQVIAQRKLAMSRVGGLEIATQLFTMAVTISFAVLGYGVWALVIGMLSGAVVNTIASHFIFAGPVMRFHFKREYALEIFHFGKWLIIASFFGFLVNRGDQLLFGGLMGADQFGLYAVASIWIVAAAAVMQTIIGRIFFPAFSEIFRDRPHDLTKAYRQTRLLVDGASIAIAYGLFFFSEFAFAIIYPDSYSGVGHYVKLLSPFILLMPFRLINQVVLAAGDSRSFTGVTVLAGSAMLVLTPGAYYLFGEKAAIVCFATIEAVALPLIWRIGSRYLTIEPATEIRALSALILLLALILWVG
ncbi:MAG: oligosaccharide flippase family protein [Marinicaulis sp.]|nr:oligosaccharide flippase family protein [Marinicaulis sp.]